MGHANRIAWPQVVFHIDLILGIAGDGRRTAPAGRARWGAETVLRLYDRLHLDYGCI
jgi:hypothetical protein